MVPGLGNEGVIHKWIVGGVYVPDLRGVIENFVDGIRCGLSVYHVGEIRFYFKINKV